MEEMEAEEWFKKRNRLYRQFTVRALKSTELLTIDLETLNKMAQEYFDEYQKLFMNKTDLLRRATILKLTAIDDC